LTQIVGKVRLASTPLVNHWWNVTLHVTSRGLATFPIPYGTRTFQLADYPIYFIAIGCKADVSYFRGGLPWDTKSSLGFSRTRALGEGPICHRLMWRDTKNGTGSEWVTVVFA
jgi:hypothetical protein